MVSAETSSPGSASHTSRGRPADASSDCSPAPPALQQTRGIRQGPSVRVVAHTCSPTQTRGPALGHQHHRLGGDIGPGPSRERADRCRGDVHPAVIRRRQRVAVPVDDAPLQIEEAGPGRAAAPRSAGRRPGDRFHDRGGPGSSGPQPYALARPIPPTSAVRSADGSTTVNKTSEAGLRQGHPRPACVGLSAPEIDRMPPFTSDSTPNVSSVATSNPTIRVRRATHAVDPPSDVATRLRRGPPGCLGKHADGIGGQPEPPRLAGVQPVEKGLVCRAVPLG